MDMKGLPPMERLCLQLRLGPRGCWLWAGANGGKADCGNRYGTIDMNGRSTASHRAAWILFIGPIGSEECVLHECDIRQCCNPLHLYVGDKKDNRRDFMERHPKTAQMIRRAQIIGGKAVKAFWDGMSAKQRAAFIARRAKIQKERRRGRARI